MNKLQPDWANAPDWAYYLAQDASGEWYWYADEPTPDEKLEKWLPYDSLSELAMVAEENSKWRQTLQQRPAELWKGPLRSLLVAQREGVERILDENRKTRRHVLLAVLGSSVVMAIVVILALHSTQAKIQESVNTLEDVVHEVR